MKFDRKLTDKQLELKELIITHVKSDGVVKRNDLRNDVIYLGSVVRTRMPNDQFKQELSFKLDILTLTVDSEEQANFLGELRMFIDTIDENENTTDDFDKEDGLI